VTNCLLNHRLRLRPGPFHAKFGDDGGFSTTGVFARRFAHRFFISLNVKNVVGDLECEAEFLTEGSERRARGARSLAQDRASLAGEGKERRRLHPLHADNLVLRGCSVFEREVHHLAADHAGVASNLSEPRDDLAAHERIAMRIRCSKQREGVGEQRVAGEDGRRLVEGLMHRRLAVTQFVIVHCRKIVVY